MSDPNSYFLQKWSQNYWTAEVLQLQWAGSRGCLIPSSCPFRCAGASKNPAETANCLTPAVVRLNDCSLPMLLSREEYSSCLLYDVAVLKTNCTWMCWYKHSFSYFELFFKNLRILFYSKWLLLYEVSITSNKENGLGTWESWAYYWLSCCMNTLVLNKQEASLSKGFLTISLPFLYL